MEKIRLNDESFASIVLFYFGAKTLGIEIPKIPDIASNLIIYAVKEKQMNYIKNTVVYSFQDVIKFAEEYVLEGTKKCLYLDDKVNHNFFGLLGGSFDTHEIFMRVIRSIFDYGHMEEITADNLYHALYTQGKVNIMTARGEKQIFDNNSTIYKINELIKKGIIDYHEMR